MRKGEVSQTANLANEGRLEFLLNLHDKGVPMSKEDIDLLVRHKMIHPKMAEKPKDRSPKTQAASVDQKSYTQSKADNYIDVVESDDISFLDDDKRHVVMDNETYDKLSETSLFKYQGGREIFRADWEPADKIYHDEDFVNWINSINGGFQSMIRYKKFAMYCQQSEDWLNDNVSLKLRDVGKTRFTSWTSTFSLKKGIWLEVIESTSQSQCIRLFVT